MTTGRHIAIVGMGPSATERKWDLPRYIPAGAEWWGLNAGYYNYRHLLSRFVRWFELHTWAYLRTCPNQQDPWKYADHMAALDALGCPVYVSEHQGGLRNQVVVDWPAVFGHHVANRGSNYFLGSPSLMLALALYEHDKGATVRQIDSWGIDTSDPSHAQQRASWAYWTAQAHARGIEMGGTATGYMHEPEKDAGLVGMRGHIGDLLAAQAQAPGSTDYVVVSMATDNEPYRSHAARLEAECKALGVECWVRILPAVDGRTSGLNLVRHEMTATVRMGLEKFGKPVIYMDADDNLIKVPTLPPDLDGAGIIDNPELQHFRDVLQGPCLPTGMICAFTPTPRGLAALEIIAVTEKHISYHRGVNALWAGSQRWGRSGVRDITPHFRGCIKVNPSASRTTVCYT